MKLFYMPGACSLASHITLREIDVDFEIERVDGSTKTTEAGQDFTQINPKGYVPALQLDDGQILTEGAAILQFLADTHPGAKLAPESGSVQRALLNEQLNFVASELHKAFAPFFSSEITDAGKARAETHVRENLDYLENLLSDGRTYLNGNTFSISDSYLFVVTRWAKPVGITLAEWPKLSALCERIASRKKVQEAMRAEGILN